MPVCVDIDGCEYWCMNLLMGVNALVDEFARVRGCPCLLMLMCGDADVYGYVWRVCYCLCLLMDMKRVHKRKVKFLASYTHHCIRLESRVRDRRS